MTVASVDHTRGMDGRLVSTTEAARTVGYSYPAVYRLVEHGVIVPQVHGEGSGARWRWSPADVALLRVLHRASRVQPAEATAFLRAIADHWRAHHADHEPPPGSAVVVTPGHKVFVMHEAEDIHRLAAAAGAVIVVALDPA